MLLMIIMNSTDKITDRLGINDRSIGIGDSFGTQTGGTDNDNDNDTGSNDIINSGNQTSTSNFMYNFFILKQCGTNNSSRN